MNKYTVKKLICERIEKTACGIKAFLTLFVLAIGTVYHLSAGNLSNSLKREWRGSLEIC